MHYALIIGLILGFVLPLTEQHRALAKKWGSRTLFMSVALLGAGLSLGTMGRNSIEYAHLTLISIALTFIFGYLLSRLFKIDHEQSILMTAGTAVCGGSAMAAVAPVINASALSMAISMSVVFILNALAIYLFPPLGHWLQLTQEQFGLWAALAIHDTSSVLAAASLYGEKALELATITKLTRSLWIIPICLVLSVVYKTQTRSKFRPPWVIVVFLAVSTLFTLVPALAIVKAQTQLLAKIGFALTLFLIGLQMNKENLKQVGWSPLAFGLSLWIIVSGLSLVLVQL
jgi:uncharacterized integral membrane protein (TIGR00698 family)